MFLHLKTAFAPLKKKKSNTNFDIKSRKYITTLNYKNGFEASKIYEAQRSYVTNLIQYDSKYNHVLNIIIYYNTGASPSYQNKYIDVLP